VFGIVLPEQPAERSNNFEVWEENWDVVMMFLRMQTQWTTTMAGYMGLRYDVLVCPGGMFDLYNVENRREMLEDLQIMEATALSELAKDKDG
jgi:energy-converting hydrogenase Eha subunit F